MATQPVRGAGQLAEEGVGREHSRGQSASRSHAEVLTEKVATANCTRTMCGGSTGGCYATTPWS
jgi:hypothetical protein